ncbi:hypothetical protein XENTR_v10014384 [Xenopus tropicalis]|uniref:Uncharacterized protein n=1 Tax=Xenopus tropicalis TaxID=8364 RepID=A0A1B8XW86_XENTR|nr:hypothetical protein XENTR_v10014384 [Xenopus tropicalis]
MSTRNIYKMVASAIAEMLCKKSQKTHHEYLLTFWNLQGPRDEVSSDNGKLRQTSYRSFIATIGKHTSLCSPKCLQRFPRT